MKSLRLAVWGSFDSECSSIREEKISYTRPYGKNRMMPRRPTIVHVKTKGKLPKVVVKRIII
jgi:hypothetical protein